MSKPHVEPTNAGNLEAKFDAGEDVLDYFELQTAKVVLPDKPLAKQTISITQLKRAVQIAEKIERLERQLGAILQPGGWS